jgi:hypothetical protein
MKIVEWKQRVAMSTAQVVISLVRGIRYKTDLTSSRPAYSVGKKWRFPILRQWWSAIHLAGLALILLEKPGLGQQIPAEGLRLWLRADQGVIGEPTSVNGWEDQSGHNNNAVPIGPAPLTVVANSINGLPAAHFDGLGGCFRLPDVMAVTTHTPATGGDLFIVVRAANSAPPAETGRGLSYFAESPKGGGTAYPDKHGTISENFGSSSHVLIALPVAPLANANLYNVSSSARG